MVLYGSGKAVYTAAAQAPRPGSQLTMFWGIWTIGVLSLGQKVPEKTAAASGGKGHPVNVLLVWGSWSGRSHPASYQLQFLGRDTTKGQGDAKTLSDRKTCSGVLK